MPHTRFLAHVDRLFAYAVSLSRDHDLAHDMLQDCAVRVFAAERVPRDDAAYRSWLFKVLRNAYIDRQRRSGAVHQHSDDDATGDVAADWDIEDHLIDALTVKQGMAQLPSHQREIIALIDMSGLSYAEVATVLDVPIGTVMSRIARARHALLVQVRDSNVRLIRVSGTARTR